MIRLVSVMGILGFYGIKFRRYMMNYELAAWIAEFTIRAAIIFHAVTMPFVLIATVIYIFRR